MTHSRARGGAAAALAATADPTGATIRSGVALAFDLFKLRIGLAIGLTALAGAAVTPGERPAWRIALLVAAVVVASAAAGAFNQYVERDLDVRMQRTRGRPFVTGRLTHGPRWLALIVAMLAAAVIVAGLAANAVAALHTLLGAFTYGVVYTVWLKRRTWLNIVVGGLAGSFAVLAGAAAVSPHTIDAAPLWLAVVLFLWTPPHFWSLAIACRRDYEAAGVPMLPVVAGDTRSARAVLAGTVLLVAASLVPSLYGLGPIYLTGALSGGLLFLATGVALVRAPTRAHAMTNFHASLIHLTLLLGGAIADVALA